MRHDPTPTGAAPVSAERLARELQALEARLACLLGGDDSACEKALIRTYETLIAQHRARLAAAAP